MTDLPASDPNASFPPTLLAASIAVWVATLALAWPLVAHFGLAGDDPGDAARAPLEHVPPFSPQALEALLEADQAGRRVAEIDWDTLRVADAERRQVVSAWLERGWIREGRGLWCAAMIFQHGNQVAHYARARELAERAVAAGCAEAKWLKAAAEDRWLLAQDRPQRYGTQFQEVDGVWRLAPVDPSVSDDERARWDVPPLAEARRHARDMNGPE
ncbi:MAG: hypothetical protein KDD82_17885 [Planctomycetes bacterium]|nr:hypothetical protein [Planctomycetota bacterium]